MTSPMPNGEPSGAPKKEDFITKHGKRIVVIIFCILVGDTIPVIIQSGLKPNEKFYAIVLVTLPYTGTLVAIFLILAKGSTKFSDQLGQQIGFGFIFLLFFGLGFYLHLGITEVEADQVLQEINRANSNPYNTTQIPILNALLVSRRMVSIIGQFYFHKYGLALFVSATLAAFVITWNIVKWTERTTLN